MVMELGNPQENNEFFMNENEEDNVEPTLIIPRVDIKFDDDSKSMTEIIEGTEAGSQHAQPPDIDNLEDAVEHVDGKPHFKIEPGSYVVIERNYPYQGNLVWLDTRVYRVESIDQETGDLALYDEEWEHHALSNFITGPARYRYKFKVPAKQKGIVKFELGKKRRKKKFKNIETGKSAKAQSDTTSKTRRMYVTRGKLHTRLSGQAYVPGGETRVTQADRMIIGIQGDRLLVKHPTDGWEEVWIKGDI